MPLDHLDPDLLVDFVTESYELIESVDQDLVRLESVPADLELLNNVFRALHTIKGSAGFLALDPLTEVAHAAEDALNCLRKGEISLTADIMTLLLQAVDTIRDQIGEIEGGEMCAMGDPNLVAGLRAVGSDGAAPAPKQGAPTGGATTAEDPTHGTDPSAEGAHTSAGPGEDAASPEDGWIELTSSKQTLVPFMADDLAKSLQELEDIFRSTCMGDDRAECGSQISSVAEELHRAVGFFGIDEITNEVDVFVELGRVLPSLSDDAINAVGPRILALLAVLNERTIGLRELRRVPYDSSRLIERAKAQLTGQALSDEAGLAPDAELDDVFRVDSVRKDEDGATPQATSQAAARAAQKLRDVKIAAAAPGGGDASGAAADRDAKRQHRVDPTIRVDVSRLESLLNLVGELVLQKNRVLALSRRVSEGSDSEAVEEIGQVASDLDRVTGELQLGVMKTRLQPLNKVFSRFPRVIRDLAQATGKQIELDIIGGDTEVDKSVIEAIGDPLVHILRNSADHAIETPSDRVAAGKAETGQIQLSAEHLGNHVLIRIQDDGKGIDPDKIGRLAVERGLVSEDELAAMSRNAILRLIFAPGFSTAKEISSISGRGVGMDVVRTNIQKLNGTVDVESEVGRGATVSMRIPLTVAIMPAMMVMVGSETYAVPLSSVQEIVRIGTARLTTVNGQPVLRNRDVVLPVIDLHEAFTGRSAERAPFAVVVNVADQSYALMVQGLVGQQEVVIKPLDDLFEGEESSFLSGATVREDGGVSLIVDVATLTKWASRSLAAAA
ncbi:MAG: chemotaxis protein CheA [Candidatus Eisenbacteria bacterium]